MGYVEHCIDSEKGKPNQRLKVKRRSWKDKQGWQIAEEMHADRADQIDYKRTRLSGKQKNRLAKKQRVSKS